jgi:FMN phosphatase YigB (HAD superfamily)
MRPRTPTVVVFDLGGVLARICHSWPEAAEAAGIDHQLGGPESAPLDALAAFDRYQSGLIESIEYISELSRFAGCTVEQARTVHNSILIGEYPGVPELIAELAAAGVPMGCLSNTNEEHWDYLVSNKRSGASAGRFPSLQAIPMKMASHRVGLKKPDPRIFQRFCAEFDLDSEQILFFDDHLANVEAANAEGWRAFLIDADGDTVDQMRNYLAKEGVLPAANR